MSDLPEIGAVLGRWTLVKRLGEGAMGPVFEARSTGGTSGALHLVRSDLVATPDATEQLKRDARAFQKVEHPNIPRLLDVDEGQGRFFLVFELVEGRTLQYRLDRKEVLTADEGRDLATDVLTGLATLHERGILHGDVAPSRLLSGLEGYWKLTGFSLVPRPPSDSAGVIQGTPLYMAPERAQGQPSSIVSDLYSAGATIYAALAGEPPFMRPSVEAILAAHVNDPPPDLGTRCQGAEKELVLLVAALLTKMPNRRPPDARTALAALGQRTKPRAKTQAPAKGPDPSEATLAPFDPAAATMAGPPPAPPPPPGTQTTKRKAHEYVEAMRQFEERETLRIPWARAIVPFLLAGGLGALAFRQAGGGAPSGPALVIAGGALAFALLGVLAVLAGVVPRGVSNHATARTLLERIPLKWTVWWSRKSDPIRAALALGQLGELGAGELLLDAGEPALAAEEFLRAQIPLAAAIVFERLGDAERAIDTYIFAGKLEDAARVAAERGKLVEAGAAFEEAGHLDRAIDAYAKAGVPLRLAVIYEGQGKSAEAAKHYELANELAKAAELYAKAGLPGEAARIHHRTGNLASVAAVWESSGDVVNAARWRAESELAAGRQTNAA
ncbi:MAG TPA: protein kinase, partial [Planctomycetota bacterium]|nr:protein kinase [Planctomycetota bacterium]